MMKVGRCNECGKYITLKANEKTCPNCGKLPYICWKCHNPIDEGSDECKVCHFFICKNCGECAKGRECGSYALLNISDLKELRQAISKAFSPPERKDCPNGVPISYAKDKLRNLALRLQGKLVRDSSDFEKFKELYDKIDNFQIGKKWTISKERSDGQFGQELRSASFLAVCMGIAKVIREKRFDKKGNAIGEYDLFERIKGIACLHENWEKLLMKQCPKCKAIKPMEQEYCDCKTIGELILLKEKKSKIDFCQLDRNEFIKKEGTKDGVC